MDIFENVKSNISMRSAAEAYGVKVNRHNRGLCPFHDGKREKSWKHSNSVIERGCAFLFSVTSDGY